LIRSPDSEAGGIATPAGVASERLSQLGAYLADWRRRRARRLTRRADRAYCAGRFAVAASLYRRAVACDPGAPEARVQLAHTLRELAKFGEAEAAYRQALARSPGDGEIQRHLSDLLTLLGRLDEARLVHPAPLPLSDAAAGTAAPDPPEAEPPDGGSPPRPEPEAEIAAGDALRDSGRYGEAAETYARALQLLPGRTDIRVQYGNMLKDSGRLAEAEAAYRTALALAPDNAETYLQLGHVFKLRGQRDAALAAYRRATDLEPSLDAAWAELSEAGCPASQQHRFEAQVAKGGVDALLAIAEEVSRLQETLRRLAETLPGLSGQVAFPVGSYDRFRRLYDVPAPPHVGFDRSFAVVMPADGISLDTLYGQIASLTAQTHRRWSLHIVGSDAARRKLVERAAVSDPRIAWVDQPGEASEATAERRVAATLSADWLVLPAPGARLHRHALAWYAAASVETPAAAFVSDEEIEIGTAAGQIRLQPVLRQAVDYDTLLAANPYGDTVAIERSTYAAIASDLADSSLSAARSSLLLALASRGAVGHIPLPLVIAPPGISRSDPAGPREHETAVRAHLAACGFRGGVVIGRRDAGAAPLSVEWRPRHSEEAIQVIIPTRDNGIDLRGLVQSLRRRAEHPEALHLTIVDNGSKEAETAGVLARLDEDDCTTVLRIDEPFNWSRLNNRAAALSDARLLVFANDDMLMLSDGWDRQLRGLLERHEIGAVGARLIYPDDTVQHAGILLGWPGTAVHDGRYEPLSNAGPCARWHVTRAVSAVTGAFLAVRRDVFDAAGGFDEIGLPVAYGDVDFALKVRERGLKVVWTPDITLRHFESKTRGFDHLDPEKQARSEAERAVIAQRWGAVLQDDPSVNPMWHAATLPFRLISMPSLPRLWRHIRLSASGNPWLADGRCDPDPLSCAEGALDFRTLHPALRDSGRAGRPATGPAKAEGCR
jgi:tetratricopeptide (TPR) repeat protein/GT2 family glycosyltransferase